MLKVRNGHDYTFPYNKVIMEVNNTSGCGKESSSNTLFNYILDPMVEPYSKLPATPNHDSKENSKENGNSNNNNNSNSDNNKRDKMLHPNHSPLWDHLEDLMRTQIDDINSICISQSKAVKALRRQITSFEKENQRSNYGNEYSVDNYKMVLSMIFADQRLSDPFIQSTLQQLQKSELDYIFDKGKVSVPQSTYLMGVADPLGVLEEGEVFIVTKQAINGDVLIARNPSCHPGDIRIFNSVVHPKLIEFINKIYNNRAIFGNGRKVQSGVIFFSIKGDRSGGDLLSNGDYDGDLYWICWDAMLVKLTKNNIPPPASPDFADAKNNSNKNNNTNNNNSNNNTDSIDWNSVTRTPKEFKCETELNEAIMTHFILWYENDCVMKHSCTLWKKACEIDGIHSYGAMALCKLYLSVLDASKDGVLLTIPQNLKNNYQYISFDFEGNRNGRKSHTIRGHIYRFIKKEQLLMNENTYDINNMLDPDLIPNFTSGNDPKIQILMQLTKKIDSDFRNAIRQLLQEYNESIKKLNNNKEIINQKKANRNFKKKQIIQQHQEKFLQYVKDNPIITEKDLAMALYHDCYKRVGWIRQRDKESKASFWVCWTIAGKILNLIKAGGYQELLHDRPMAVHPKHFEKSFFC